MQPEKPDCEVGLRYGTVKYGKACNVRYGGNGVGKSEKSSQVGKRKAAVATYYVRELNQDLVFSSQTLGKSALSTIVLCRPHTHLLINRCILERHRQKIIRWLVIWWFQND